MAKKILIEGVICDECAPYIEARLDIPVKVENVEVNEVVPPKCAECGREVKNS